jgi:microcystin-dependent protein
MEAYVGSIFAFGFDFAPTGWLLCAGQTLSITEYEPLFTLIGTTYGGDGISNFCIPDLRSRIPIGTGHGAGLQNYALGQKGGSPATTLTVANMPAHSHETIIQVPVGTTSDASDATAIYFGTATSDVGNTYETTFNVQMAVNASITSLSGAGNPPLDTINPYLVVNYCICTLGLFPTHP